jgi:hypothetical protein
MEEIMRPNENREIKRKTEKLAPYTLTEQD